VGKFSRNIAGGRKDLHWHRSWLKAFLLSQEITLPHHYFCWLPNVMIKEITAKTLLSPVKQPDDWFGLKYNMNLYRGCQHQCIYCDSRSKCYQIENFNDILVKVNAIDLLRDELSRKRVKGTIGTGSMNDPYMPLETKKELTRGALQVIADFHFPVHIITKSDLVLRDLDLLRSIREIYAAVTLTITTADDQLGMKLEPAAARVSDRFKAIQVLARNGILTGVTLMPVLPFLEDNLENIRQIVTRAHQAGASYIIPSFGMTLRDRQRDYFYRKLDHLFPGLRAEYERQFGYQYHAAANNALDLEREFQDLCQQFGIATRIPLFSLERGRQMAFFNEPN
jgi:DNA repair photolyase